MAILRSPATVPGSEVLPGSVLSLVMLLHHLSVLRHLHLPPDEHQHEQDHCRGLLELGAEHEARILLDDAEAEPGDDDARNIAERSEEHTSELQSLMRTSYAVFCLKKK